MKIELKAFKHSEFASQETNCFEANIYIDGKKAGWAENSGRGGMTNIQPRACYETLKQMTDTLPIKIVDYNGEKLELDNSPDTFIDELVIFALHEKDLKKAMKSKILYLRKDQLFETNRLTASEMSFSLKQAGLKEKLNADEVLNLMPLAQALHLYTARI